MPFHLLVAYYVVDHAFVNNTKLSKMDDKKLWTHFIWVVLVFLAFTFDVFLSNPLGILLLILSIGVTVTLDMGRKKLSNHLIEIIAFFIFLFFTLLGKSYLSRSFVTTEFSWYLLGMLATTVGVTYFLRGRILAENATDSIGIAERMSIFIFVLAGHWEWTLIAIGAALTFRVVFSKDGKIEWLISPVAGVGLSFLWQLLMRSMLG
ncbi:MAG TPA: hypothetical protein PLA66_04010 [Mesotoga sp.]|jgi:hypothetical protein|nr:hypothetical protein [Mesotoga sp.]HPX21991.1 hypothetical protein [Mesotoga sp.]